VTGSTTKKTEITGYLHVSYYMVKIAEMDEKVTPIVIFTM
jgi:hypothetical protein